MQYNINMCSAYAVMKLIKLRWGASAQTICRFSYFLREGQFVIVDNSVFQHLSSHTTTRFQMKLTALGCHTTQQQTDAKRRTFIVTTPTMDSGKPTPEVATLIAPTARVAKPLVPTSTWGFIYGEDEHHDAATPSHFHLDAERRAADISNKAKTNLGMPHMTIGTQRQASRWSPFQNIFF